MNQGGIPPLLTRRDLAVKLGVSVSWLQKHPEIPHVRLGRLVKYDEATVADWLRRETEAQQKRRA